MANPTLLKTPIASGGDKNTIPETTGSTTGLLSQEKGWQQINSLPINAGGIAPSRLDFNGVFNLLSNILFYTQKGWQWEFDETQSYFAGCTVKDTVDGKTYVCIADVNASTTHPSADTTHWKLSDLATKDDLANYLPLSGGAMTGPFIYRSVQNDILRIVGGPENTDAPFIQLNGVNVSGSPASFVLASKNGIDEHLLRGNIDGTLTWDGANVLTDANGGYLPLSGGAMTGGNIKRNADNSYIELAGGTSYSKGAFLDMFGKDHNQYPYEFWLNSGDYRLVGKPNGTLTWNNNDLGGASIVAKSLGTTGYIKYASGLVMQWGNATNLPASQDVVPVTFPITFPNGVGSVVITSAGDYGNQRGFSWGQIKDVTTTGFKLSEASTDVDSQGKNWFAIGY